MEIAPGGRHRIADGDRFEFDRITVDSRLFDRDDAVAAIGKNSSRRDTNRLTGTDTAVERLPHQDLADDPQPPGRTLGGECKSIHRRASPGRYIRGGSEVARKPTPQSVVEFDLLAMRLK